MMRTIAHRAYVKYIPRIGRTPAPMKADFSGHIARNEALVAEKDENICGYVVAYPSEDVFFIENIAVDPSLAGQGIGYALMNHVEAAARLQGFGSMRLYTNVRMWENFSFYGRLGYHKTKIIAEAGFRRVYFEKDLH